jgi:hypothetical protein
LRFNFSDDVIYTSVSPREHQPWALVVFGGGFGFSCYLFLVIHTLHKENSKHLYNLYISAGVGIGISNLLIACIGSYLLSSITHPLREITYAIFDTLPGNDAKMLGSKDVLKKTLV